MKTEQEVRDMIDTLTDGKLFAGRYTKFKLDSMIESLQWVLDERTYIQ